MKKMPTIFLMLCLLVLCCAQLVGASDLDDGISKPYDEPIERDDELGQKDRNVSFIKRNARSKGDVAATAAGKKGESVQSVRGGSGPSTGNLNSVVLGVGGTVRGDIVIIDQSRGDKNQVIGR